MILYRALNKEDMDNLFKKGMITSSLISSSLNLNSYPKQIQKKVIQFYSKCCKEVDKNFMLSLVCGHVNGKLVSAKRSPWISTTADFFTAYNYAILSKCKSDFLERRFILCFEVKENMIIKESSDLKMQKIKCGTVLDLSCDKLTNYRTDNLIMPFEYEKNTLKINSNYMLGNYATADSEYLVANYIKLDNYLLLAPASQDQLLHSYGNQITEYISDILISKCKTSNSLHLVKKMI